MRSPFCSTAVGNLPFNLAGDCRGYNLCIQLGALYLKNIDLNILVCDLLELFLEFLNLRAALADDKARTRCAYCDCDELKGALNYDTGDT